MASASRKLFDQKGLFCDVEKKVTKVNKGLQWNKEEEINVI